METTITNTNPSLGEMKKDELVTLLTGVAEKIQLLEKFYKENLVDNGTSCNQTQINNFVGAVQQSKKSVENIASELEKYKSETLVDSEERKSTKTRIDNLLSTGDTSVKSLEQKNAEITTAHELILVDKPGTESLKTQIVNIKDEFSKNLSENSVHVNDLKSFHKTVFEKSVDDKGVETQGLKEAVSGLKIELRNLIDVASEKLAALTDHALHNSYARQANKHTQEERVHGKQIRNSVFAIVVTTLFFGAIQLVNIIWLEKRRNDIRR